MAEEKKSNTMKVHSDNSVYEKAKTLEDSNYGKYAEANGGGTPIGEGEASPKGYDGANGRGAMQRIEKSKEAQEERGGNQQPRTDDGKFTYNSVNGKGLSNKSNPNRNKTVNPLLTGGQNGVSQEEFEKQIREGSGEYWDKFSEIALVKEGSYTYRGKIYSMDAVSMADALRQLDKGSEGQGREYYEKNKAGDNAHTWTRKGGFSGQISSGKGKEQAEGYKLDEMEAKQKMGRHSKEEKEALANVGTQRNVMVKVGDKSMVLTKRDAKGPEFKPTKHNADTLRQFIDEVEGQPENRFEHDVFGERTARRVFNNNQQKQPPRQDTGVGVKKPTVSQDRLNELNKLFAGVKLK